MSLHLQNVGFQFASKTILHPTDVTIAPGSLLAVVGPNGAGKSTLLKIIAQQLTPTTGRVTWHGQDLHAFSPLERARKMSWLPQTWSSPFPFKAIDFVVLGRFHHHEGFPTQKDYTLAGEVLSDLGLTPLQDRPLNQLSGGERQAIALARVIAQQSPLMILDEPWAALDWEHILFFIHYFNKLTAAGHTILLSSHELTVTFTHLPQALLMAEGRVVASGKTPEVLNPSHLAATFHIQSEIFYHEKEQTNHLLILK